MSEKNAEQIKTLYTELARLAPGQDWERLLKVSKKILGYSVSEKKAFQTKIVCLIHLGRFEEALTSIERNQDSSVLHFERAYCQYRLNRIQEAHATLKDCPREMTASEKELMAQIMYKLENYQESYDYYKDIIKNIDDDFDNERQTNVSAVVSMIRQTSSSGTASQFDMSNLENESYELCYNSACIALSEKKYSEAQTKLKQAEKMCNEFFSDPDDPEDIEDLNNEIAIIRVQLAYCLHKQNEKNQAHTMYDTTLKQRPADASVIAVASNNLVCLNKEGTNVFETRKRLRTATSAELNTKLTSAQRCKIAFNEILFAMNSNQNSQSVNKLIEAFRVKFPNFGAEHSLLKMSQLYKDKKYAEAEKCLRESPDGKSTNGDIKYYLLQVVLAQQNKTAEAISLLRQVEDYKTYKSGIVSSLVALNKRQKDVKAVSTLLDEAINYVSKTNASNDPVRLEQFVKENANFQIEVENFKQACVMLEKWRQLKPNDFKILSKLINVYSKFDTDKANQLSKELPSLEDIQAGSELDIDLLETQFSLLTSKYSKLKSSAFTGTGGPGTGQMKSPPGNKTVTKTSEADNKKKVVKRKRKVILPKNFDPKATIDPERWLPLRERSYFRGKRNKKKNMIGKGTQGAVGGGGGGVAAAAVSAKESPRAEPSADKPKAKSSSSNNKNKKKKGNKW